jgi:hypothetical protein
MLALALTLFTITNAITEDESVVGLRDANTSKERPRLEGYDMDESVQQ